MPDLTIKPNAGSGNKLIFQDQAGGAVLTTADSGATLTAPTISDLSNVTGTLVNAVQDNITRLGTVTQGNLQGTTWRRINGIMAYLSNSSNNNTTNPKWVLTGMEGSGVGFHLNSDSCITHVNNTTSFTCNQAGVYFVYCSVLPFSSSGNQGCRIRKNGTNMTDTRNARDASSTPNHASATAAVILQLAVNDSVDIATHHNCHQGYYNNFVMFKLGDA